MNFLKFKNKKLFFENTAISKVATRIKTPFYLYSLGQLRFNFNNFKKSFKKINPIICFSVKSNSNLKLISELKKLGSGADVVSIGELKIALKAGISPKKIVFSGVGKTEEELDFAIKKEILLINAESEAEIRAINKIAKKNNKIVSVGIRINPNISAKTNKKISTGKKDNKFGISMNACDFYNKNKGSEWFNTKDGWGENCKYCNSYVGIGTSDFGISECNLRFNWNKFKIYRSRRWNWYSIFK